MGRATIHTEDRLLDVAAVLAAAGGADALQVKALSAASGAPVGSIYHLFESRDALVAALWLSRVTVFQNGFIRFLEKSHSWADGLGAALYTPRFCRRDPTTATLLLAHSREAFVGEAAPEAMRGAAADLAVALQEGLRDFRARAGRSGPPVGRDALRFALIDGPMAAVKPHLRKGRAPGPAVDHLVETTYQALTGC